MTSLIEFINVSKKYSNNAKYAIENVNFNIRRGESIAYLGPNGAGKTTTCKIMTTVLYPTSGKVLFKGKDIFKNRISYLKNIGVMFGNKTKLMENISLENALYLMCSIYGVDKKICKERLNYLTEALGISHLLKRRLREFSLGERTKSELVASLLHSPEILILDEPTIGVDIISRKALYDVIKDYIKEGGTLFITSHNTEDIRELAERIILLNKGSIVFDGKYEDFVKTFSGERVMVKLTFEDPEEYKKATSLFKNAQYYGETLSIRMELKRNEIKKILTEISNFIHVNINIQEEPLEDIIRRSFNAE